MSNINKVTIVMYHYIRDLKKSRYPKIKGLDLFIFIEQLNYLQMNYNIITMEQLIDSIYNNEPLAPKAVLLTFDDCYLDHFTNVFPVLFDRKIQGSFFPSAKAISEDIVIDVNKIHFILASVDNIRRLVSRTFIEIDKYRIQYKLVSNDYYYKKLGIANHLDVKEVVYIKRLLQKELPKELRSVIVNTLFDEFVGMSEIAFSNEMYMSKGQLKCMIQNGMHVGNHGYDHCWLNSLSEEDQRIEVRKGCELLNEIGVDMNWWTMCYPYGAYNPSTINILKEANCKLGLTTAVDIADLSVYNMFALPRLDANDIPTASNSKVNDWFYQG